MSKIVLIGGPPGAGKTTLSRGLAHRLGCASLSVDDLAIAIRSVTTAASHPAFHLMRAGHREYFTTGPPEKLITDALGLEDAIWPTVDQLISSRLRKAEGLVLDWWLLPPARVAAIVSGQVTSLWLHIDPAELDRRERSNTGFRVGSVDEEQMHANFMARSLWRNTLVADEAARLDLPLLHQTGSIGRERMVDLALQKLS